MTNLVLFIIFQLFYLNAVSNVDQGMIKYKVELEGKQAEIAEHQDFVTALLEELEMTIYFSKEQIRTDLNLEELYQLKTFIDRKSQESVVYMDLFGRRIKTPPQKIPDIPVSEKPLIKENKHITKKIAGLHSYEMEMSWPTDTTRTTIKAYVSDQFNFEFVGFGLEAFASLKKVPLEYHIDNEVFNLRIFAVDFSQDLKSNVFKRPAGYETKDMDEIGNVLSNSPFMKSFGQ